MRIAFEDEMAGRGEIDLAKVHRGDRVRFESDFHKVGDDEDDDLTKTVDAGAIGKVVAVDANAGLLKVVVPCTVKALKNVVTGDTEMFIPPDDVVLLVRKEDARVSSARMAPEHLKVALAALELPKMALSCRDIVAVELHIAGDKGAADAVARSDRDAWRAFVLDDPRARQAAAQAPIWFPYILWAAVTDHRDAQSVAECLQKTAEWMRAYGRAERWQPAQRVAAEMRYMAATVRNMDQKTWLRCLPGREIDAQLLEVLEEPGSWQPGPEEPSTPQKARPRPWFDEPPRYNVSMGGPDAGSPHGWPTTP